MKVFSVHYVCSHVHSDQRKCSQLRQPCISHHGKVKVLTKDVLTSTVGHERVDAAPMVLHIMNALQSQKVVDAGIQTNFVQEGNARFLGPADNIQYYKPFMLC